MYSAFDCAHRRVPAKAKPYDYILEVVKRVTLSAANTPTQEESGFVAMQPVPFSCIPERLNRLVYIPEIAPILSILLPPGPNDYSGSLHPCPPASAVVLSTPTVSSGIASLGWIHANQQQPASRSGSRSCSRMAEKSCGKRRSIPASCSASRSESCSLIAHPKAAP